MDFLKNLLAKPLARDARYTNRIMHPPAHHQAAYVHEKMASFRLLSRPPFEPGSGFQDGHVGHAAIEWLTSPCLPH